MNILWGKNSPFKQHQRILKKRYKKIATRSALNIKNKSEGTRII